jgi:hypothetical protein
MKIPNWMFLTAIFVLGGASALIGNRLLELSIPTEPAEPPPSRSAMLAHLDSVMLGDSLRVDAGDLGLAKFEAFSSGGLPTGMPSLNLSIDQRRKLNQLFMRVAPIFDSVRMAFFPRLEELGASTLREMSCVLTPKQRHLWLAAVYPNPTFLPMRRPDSVVVFVPDSGGQTADGSRSERAANSASPLNVFGSDADLDRWCQKHKPA